MTLIEQTNIERKARHARMQARIVPDDGIDLRRNRPGAAPKKSCAEDQPQDYLALISDLRAQVAFLKAALAHPIAPSPQPEIAAERFEPILDDEPGKVTVARIKNLISREYGVSIEVLESHRREGFLSLPRHIVIHLSRKLTPNSLPSLGRMFGGRHHSTILHADQKMTALRSVDASLDAELAEYERQLVGAL